MREMRWTDEQVDAITASGNVLLAASAGTGKTTTIVGKVMWMLGLDVGVRASTGEPVPPCPSPCALEEVAAITFTEKAAYDLKGKLRREIECSERADQFRWEVDRASVGTIHGFCGELLREHALRLGIDPTFRVLDERETQLRQDELLRDVIFRAVQEREPETVALVKKHGLYRMGQRRGVIDVVREVMHDIRWRAHRYEAWTRMEEPSGDGSEGTRVLDRDKLSSLAAEAGLWAPEVVLDGCDSNEDERSIREAAALYRLARAGLRDWLRWLEEENVRDFDSLILDARRLLTRPETRTALESMRSRFRILIIDEFQDTDGAQRDIAFAVAGQYEPAEGGPQLLLVGDPKQSIYGFRGADITVWNEVREALCPNGYPMALTHNFRSEPTVVDFVNRVCGTAMDERAEAVAAESPRSKVSYQALVANRPETVAGGLEWLAADSEGKVAERLEAEGKLIGSRIRQLVGTVTVFDPDEDEYRTCRYGDIAVLARKKKILTGIESGLREYGVPYFNSVTGGLADRREVMDLVTVLRLIDNPRDDLRAFAFLRSPFVGLRDEVLARIRLDPSSGKKTYLRQADAYLTAVTDGSTDWFEAPESVLISEVERTALRTGLTAINEAQALVDRAEPSELLEGVLEATGYRLHLLLGEGAEEALANIERFLALLEDYRHLPVSRILDLWDLWGDQDLGIPQARLSSKDDNVVTLSTIHTAKGLEWPVVVLAGTRDRLLGASDRFWSDPRFGPVFLPNKRERGPRSAKLHARANLEAEAEEARLLYVAATRARDRLVVAGPTDGNLVGYAAWLGSDLDGALEEAEAAARLEAATGDDTGNGRPDPSAHAHHEATGTGRQMDAFGGDHPDGKGQLDMFTAPVPAPAVSPEPGSDTAPAPVLPCGELVIYRRLSPIQGNLAQVPVALWWLSGITSGEAPPLVRPISAPSRSFLSSATELMMRENEPERWAAQYLHGVEGVDRFAPSARGVDVPAHVRGTLIHGVLEKIREAEELSRILNEAIGGIDAPELEDVLSAGSGYREALEREIEQVVSSPLWRWYVEADHHRELPFMRLAGDRNWIHGAFDLYRPPAPDAGLVYAAAEPDLGLEGEVGDLAADPERDQSTWIIDFKTHRIEENAIPETARAYRVQADVYMDAVRALLEPTDSVRLALHFTRPNRAIEMS